jgi:hypothetical protein
MVIFDWMLVGVLAVEAGERMAGRGEKGPACLLLV